VLKLAGAESSGGGQGEARGETVARGTQWKLEWYRYSLSAYRRPGPGPAGHTPSLNSHPLYKVFLAVFPEEETT
jgi:hypothetical protein